jgi:hypothetical protein
MADPFSTAASIIDLLCKTKKLYDKFQDIKNLPEAFEAITSQIDVASSIFEKIKNDTSVISRDAKLQTAIGGCEADAQELHAIYELVSEQKREKALKRYWG